MDKYFLLASLVFFAGCTSDLNHNFDYPNDFEPFVLNESRIFGSLDDFPFLRSANPSPNSEGFSVNDYIVFYFNEWGEYSDYSFGLFERESLSQVSIDTTPFDYSDNTDYGLKPFDDKGPSALKPGTEYLVQITSRKDEYLDHYYSFTTGEADNIKPEIEDAYFENNDLVIIFSEKIKSWTFKEDGNLLLKKDGTELSADFESVRTSASPSYMDRMYYIEYDLRELGEYELIIKNVKDSSGNVIENYSFIILND